MARTDDKALDAELPIASLLKLMLLSGDLANATIHFSGDQDVAI
jgi:hypothetical protein